MDPDAALRNFRAHATLFYDLCAALDSDEVDIINTAADAIANALELDRWLSKGGYLPDGWNDNRG